MSDDLLESDTYFVRPEYRAEPEEPSEQIPTRTPMDRKRTLLRIAHDTAEPFSVRQDAKRLLELADIYPRDFASRYTEFIEWRRHYQKENP